MNPQAEELNSILKNENPAIFSLLSQKGQSIFFPKKGLIKQGQDAKGKKINASIGMATQEDGAPLHLSKLQELINLSSDKIFPYASSYGVKELREIWLNIMREKNPRLKNIPLSLPVVTNALTHGLSMVGYLFIDEGDEVIIPNYYWGNYNLVFSNAYGAKINTFEMYTPTQGFNIEGLKNQLLGPGEKKILLLNFPNNPTGYTPSNIEMEHLAETIKDAAKKGKKIVVITDDAYFGLVYEENIIKESPFAYLADLDENIIAVKVDGATKEDYVWGFRVGFVTFSYKGMSEKAGTALTDKIGGAIRGSISNDSLLSQNLLIEAYKSPDYKADKEEKYNLLASRYQLVKELIESHPEFNEEFSALPYNSGYFMCIKPKNVKSEELRQILLQKYDTGIMAIGELVRIAYSSLPLKYIEELFINIYRASRELQGKTSSK